MMRRVLSSRALRRCCDAVGVAVGLRTREDSLVDVAQAKNHDGAVAMMAKGADVHARERRWHDGVALGRL